MTRYSQLATPTATREHLKRWGLHMKKSLGQHFLVDDGVVGRIIKLADVKEADRIIEVGPGIGTLTMALLAHGAEVFAVEKDTNLLNPLANLFEQEPLFSLIAADALDLDYVAGQLEEHPGNNVTAGVTDEGGASRHILQANCDEKPPSPHPSLQPPSPHPSSLKLVANLPYAVAATIVLAYFERFASLSSATVMVQREVAERMMARPGTKEYGAYTVKLGMLVEPQGSFAVSRANFMPPPRVDSTVIRLDRLPRCCSCTEPCGCLPASQLYENTRFVVDAAFAQRRKTIRNSMRAHFSANGRDPVLVDALLENAGIDPGCRGETLEIGQYKKLGSLL